MSYPANNIHQNFSLILDLEKPTCKKTSLSDCSKRIFAYESKEFIHSVAEILTSSLALKCLFMQIMFHLTNEVN